MPSSTIAPASQAVAKKTDAPRSSWVRLGMGVGVVVAAVFFFLTGRQLTLPWIIVLSMLAWANLFASLFLDHAEEEQAVAPAPALPKTQAQLERELCLAEAYQDLHEYCDMLCIPWDFEQLEKDQEVERVRIKAEVLGTKTVMSERARLYEQQRAKAIAGGNPTPEDAESYAKRQLESREAQQRFVHEVETRRGERLPEPSASRIDRRSLREGTPVEYDDGADHYKVALYDNGQVSTEQLRDEFLFEP